MRPRFTIRDLLWLTLVVAVESLHPLSWRPDLVHDVVNDLAPKILLDHTVCQNSADFFHGLTRPNVR